MVKKSEEIWNSGNMFLEIVLNAAGKGLFLGGGDGKQCCEKYGWCIEDEEYDPDILSWAIKWLFNSGFIVFIFSKTICRVTTLIPEIYQTQGKKKGLQ